MAPVNFAQGVSLLTLADEVPDDCRSAFLDIVPLTDEFCQRHLNEEYRRLCRKMAVKIGQAGAHLQRGKRASWACGIVYAVGWVNFLTDPSQSPHLRAEEIAQGFGVSEATMHNKAREIREGLDLVALDPEFCLPSRLDENPLVWMLQVNGLVTDIRTLPREAQQAAFDQGLIPYIPADGDASPRQEIGSLLPARPKPQADLAFQLKTTLRHIEPPIWRRIQVRDCTLDDLHVAIQGAFGWEDSHMHQFKIGKTYYGDVAAPGGDFDEMEDSCETLLSAVIPAGKKKFRFEYQYDFGDDWIHEIEVEQRLTVGKKDKLPACIDGARACPPEDCGGPWDYADMLDALADPQHEMHDEMLEWCGPIDPEKFDAVVTTKRMRRMR